MRVTCKHCGGSHPAFDCKKSTGVVSAKSAVAKKAVGSSLPVDTNTRVEDNVGARLLMSEAPETTSVGTVGYKDRQPIPKRGRGRPRTITDMKAYKAMKQREYRARKKHG